MLWEGSCLCLALLCLLRHVGSSNGGGGGDERQTTTGSSTDMAAVSGKEGLSETKEEEMADSTGAAQPGTIPYNISSVDIHRSKEGYTDEFTGIEGQDDDFFIQKAKKDDDESTVDHPEEYYKAMHRQRVRVPKYIVPTPLLDVSRRADIVMFNQKDIAPISEYHARKEREALIAIFSATNGHDWTNKSDGALMNPWISGME